MENNITLFRCSLQNFAESAVFDFANRVFLRDKPGEIHQRAEEIILADSHMAAYMCSRFKDLSIWRCDLLLFSSGRKPRTSDCICYHLATCLGMENISIICSILNI